jgi:hypothetical protein
VFPVPSETFRVSAAVGVDPELGLALLLLLVSLELTALPVSQPYMAAMAMTAIAITIEEPLVFEITDGELLSSV